LAQLRYRRMGALEALGWNKRQQRLADDFLTAVMKEPLGLGIPGRDGTVLAPAPNRVARSFNDRRKLSEALLVLPRLGLRSLQLRLSGAEARLQLAYRVFKLSGFQRDLPFASNSFKARRSLPRASRDRAAFTRCDFYRRAESGILKRR
jgi:hypothetical protein